MLNAAVTPSRIEIYKVTNLVNGKWYVGQTRTTAARRFYQHCHSAIKKKLKNPFHKAIAKYGKDSFSFETVLICDENMANYYERSVLDFYDCYAAKGNGYNVADPLNHFSSISNMKGEAHHSAKLTENDVLQIRSDIAMSHADIAKKYGISYGTVKIIRSGKSWSHIGGLVDLSLYKKDKRSGERHHYCAVSDADRTAIKADRTTNTCDLARKYGIDAGLVGHIRGPQPQIPKPRQISEEIGQYIIDHPHISNSVLSKQTGVSLAQISRIKSGKQFRHLKSSASKDQWDAYFDRRHKATGGKIG